MRNSLYQFTLRVLAKDTDTPGRTSGGALVPCYASAGDHRSALRKGVTEIAKKGYRFDTVEGSVHQLDPDRWGDYVAKVWPEFARDLPSQEEVIGLVSRGGVFFGPFVGFGTTPRTDETGQAEGAKSSSGRG